MPNATAKHNYTVNSLCLDAVSKWLEENITEEDESIVIPEAEYLESSWSVVSGTPLTLDSMKIVVIPSETMDTSGMIISREWIDIPQWIPDYFIAVQVDLQQKSILLWGYVHANTVKQKATLNQTHQYYTLSQDRMSLDLELFGITEPLVAKPQIKPEKTLTRKHIDLNEVLQQLSRPSPYSPRLDLPFEIWSALISDRQWCKKLYQQRCLNATNNSATNLLQWLQKDVVDPLKSGWRELSELLSSKVTQTPQLSFALRDESSQEKKWTKKAKLIDLKVQLDNSIPIILLIAIAPKAEDKYSIVVRLHPDSDRFLPDSINLSLLSNSKLLKEATSRSQDSYLQLGFICPIETSFEIKVTYKEKVYLQEVFFFE